MSKYSQIKYAESCWAGDILPASFFSGLLELEASQFRKPELKVMIAWGGNWTRAMDSSGNILATITSSSEDVSGDYPDDRAIDGIRPHKDPTDSSWNGYWRASNATAPQWLLIDMGVERTVNRIILYHYYDITHCLEDFKIQSSDDGITFIDRKIIINNNESKTIIEWDSSITARYWRLYIDSVANNNIAKVQEIEFFNYIDESNRIESPEGVPQYSINMSISGEVNSLPEPMSFSLTMKNEDNRFSPYNENSEIYGTKQLDNVGYIRSGTPVIIKGGFYNSLGQVGYVEIMQGQIGSEDNPAASTGITINTGSRTAEIVGKDFSNILRTTDIPKGLQVYEGNDIDELILEAGYIANIPYQDMEIEATGITIPYAIFPEGSVWNAMELLRESIYGKLFTSYNETLKFISTIPYRSWLQSELADFLAGTYNTSNIDVTTQAGKILQVGQDSQADWNAGTRTNVDITSSPNNVILSLLNHQTIISQPSEYYFNTIAGNDRLANAFSVNSKLPIQRIRLKLRWAFAAPTSGGVNVYIKDSKFTPVGLRPNNVVASGSVSYTAIPAASGYVDIDLSTPIVLDSSVYWVDIKNVMSAGAYLGVTYYNATWPYGIGVSSGDDGVNYTKINNWALTFFVLGQKYNTNGTMVTQTINYGFTPSDLGKINIGASIPAGCKIELYGEMRIADAGWTGLGTYLGTMNAGESNGNFDVSLLGIMKQYLRVAAILYTDSNQDYTPTLYSIFPPSEWISQEHDFTVNLLEWGVLTANYANGENIKAKLHTYDVLATAYSEADAVEVNIGSKITSPLKRYGKLKIILSRSVATLAVELWDFTINWLVTSGLTRNQVFQLDFTGANKKVQAVNYQLGNPKCNYAKVRINPYILQALATVWEYPELPLTIPNGESRAIEAYYSYPSIRNSGADIRKVNLTISAVAGTCDDDDTAVINGCNISFNSGANIGTIIIANASGGSRTITAMTISATELHDAQTEGRQTQVTAIDDTSVTFYGNKRFEKTIDNMFIPTLQYGQDLADALVLWDRYSKGYISRLIVAWVPNLTLQDIVSMTHPHIPIAGRQTIPTNIMHNGFKTTIQCIETLS